MYNGIGLQTVRGSGTNGHVQKNCAVVRRRDRFKDFKNDSKIDQASQQPNKEILEHARRRKIELKLAEFVDTLQEQGLSTDEIQLKVKHYREVLQLKDKEEEESQNVRRGVLQETHHIAEANLQKNSLLRNAFGISEFFVEGTSFDPERRERENQLKAAIGKKYLLVRSPSPSLEEEHDAEKESGKNEEARTSKNKKNKHKSPKTMKKSKHKKKEKITKKSTNMNYSSGSDSSDDKGGDDGSIDRKSKKKRERTSDKSKKERSKKVKKHRSESRKSIQFSSKNNSSDDDSDASADRKSKRKCGNNSGESKQKRSRIEKRYRREYQKSDKFTSDRTSSDDTDGSDGFANRKSKKKCERNSDESKKKRSGVEKSRKLKKSKTYSSDSSNTSDSSDRNGASDDERLASKRRHRSRSLSKKDISKRYMSRKYATTKFHSVEHKLSEKEITEKQKEFSSSKYRGRKCKRNENYRDIRVRKSSRSLEAGDSETVKEYSKTRYGKDFAQCTDAKGRFSSIDIKNQKRLSRSISRERRHSRDRRVRYTSSRNMMIMERESKYRKKSVSPSRKRSRSNHDSQKHASPWNRNEDRIGRMHGYKGARSRSGSLVPEYHDTKGRISVTKGRYQSSDRVNRRDREYRASSRSRKRSIRDEPKTVVRRHDRFKDFKNESKNDQASQQPNKETLEHVRRRKIELKLAEFVDTLEEQGLSTDEIQLKVKHYREVLQLKDKEEEESQKVRRGVLQETHHIAEANPQKNSLLRNAFGISEFFVEGTSFDPERRERENQLKVAIGKKYALREGAMVSPSNGEEFMSRSQSVDIPGNDHICRTPPIGELKSNAIADKKEMKKGLEEMKNNEDSSSGSSSSDSSSSSTSSSSSSSSSSDETTSSASSFSIRSRTSREKGFIDKSRSRSRS